MNLAPPERNLYKSGSRASLPQHAQFGLGALREPKTVRVSGCEVDRERMSGPVSGRLRFEQFE